MGQIEVFEGSKPGVVVEFGVSPSVIVRIAVTVVVAIGEYVCEKIVPRIVW